MAESVTAPPPPAHGWLVLDKPAGMTSAAAVARVRRLFATSKAGHGGTLDPLATGVLPIALGEATKTVGLVIGGPKAYRFAVRWGAETSTGDLEGDVVASSSHRPSEGALRSILHEFIGRIEQAPPAFSAIKLRGERAYARARRGEEFVLPPRKVDIYDLRLIAHAPDEALLVLECGKGTYVRSLARDLGRRLGCLGHAQSLRRTAAGPFTEAHMISLAKLEEFGHKDAGRKAMMTALRPLRTALDDIPALALSEADARRLKQGQPVPWPALEAPSEHQMVLALDGETPVALAAVRDGVLRPRRVFNL